MSPESSPSGQPSSSGDATKQPASLPLDDPAKRADVPVFRCLIYIAHDPHGGIQARVANLPDLTCSVADEREALATLVPRFKQQIRQWMESGSPIPWIEPPSPPETGEQKRLIPVHL